jgi:hypothetical protein
MAGSPPPLRELQLRLRELIFRHGDGSPQSLEGLSRGASELPIRDDPRLRAGERLAIYARMHFLRIRDVLIEDFPATCRAVGEDVDRFVERYLAAFPTDDPSLRRAGRHLPRFLAKSSRSTARPWHEDLARLEWAMIEAFDAADDPVLTRASLGELASDRWPDLRLETVRSLRILELDFPVDEIREGLLQRDEMPPQQLASAGAVQLRVWRQGFRVFQRRLDATEWAALHLVAGRATFGELCERLAEEIGEDDATQRVLHLLDLWLADDLLAALPTT